MTVITSSIHRILLDQPQALHCPNGPLGSTPKLTVLDPTSHSCDTGTLCSACQRATLFTPLSTRKLFSGRGSGQMPGGHS